MKTRGTAKISLPHGIVQMNGRTVRRVDSKIKKYINKNYGEYEVVVSQDHPHSEGARHIKEVKSFFFIFNLTLWSA